MFLDDSVCCNRCAPSPPSFLCNAAWWLAALFVSRKIKNWRKPRSCDGCWKFRKSLWRLYVSELCFLDRVVLSEIWVYKGSKKYVRFGACFDENLSRNGKLFVSPGRNMFVDFLGAPLLIVYVMLLPWGLYIIPMADRVYLVKPDMTMVSVTAVYSSYRTGANTFLMLDGCVYEIWSGFGEECGRFSFKTIHNNICFGSRNLGFSFILSF